MLYLLYTSYIIIKVDGETETSSSTYVNTTAGNNARLMLLRRKLKTRIDAIMELVKGPAFRSYS